MIRHPHLTAQSVVQQAMLMMGMGFMAAALSTDIPIMDADVYGAGIGAYPAEWWAATIIAACLVYLTGVSMDGRWPYVAPVLRIVGLFWHIFTVTAFMVGGYGSEGGMHLTLWSGAVLYVLARFLLWNLAGMAGQMRGGAHGTDLR